ncbi:TetR/AcrR family transcriptional regulator [Novosphingobium terrae]|uniref:TetR/AcrR family transcriptional regulator n=1 Tax=Novosphingobium terrae TaxID=2726189 RepID=UPI0019817FE1|nr:TetR/AcrR family transcriptional regulator [Novosphingobium terrae]
MPREASAKARYDGQENRRLVLEAALQVFSDLGFAGASTRVIAAAAGIEQGHLAYYFPSKLALWQQVIEAFARDGEAYLAEHLTDQALADPAATARAILPGYLRSFAANPRLTRLMLQEFSVLSPRHDWVVEHIGKPVWQRLSPLFRALAAGGHLGSAQPEIAYFSLIGAALITFGNPELVQALTGADTHGEAWIDQAIAHMLRPILPPS